MLSYAFVYVTLCVSSKSLAQFSKILEINKHVQLVYMNSTSSHNYIHKQFSQRILWHSYINGMDSPPLTLWKRGCKIVQPIISLYIVSNKIISNVGRHILSTPKCKWIIFYIHQRWTSIGSFVIIWYFLVVFTSSNVVDLFVCVFFCRWKKMQLMVGHHPVYLYQHHV